MTIRYSLEIINIPLRWTWPMKIKFIHTLRFWVQIDAHMHGLWGALVTHLTKRLCCSAYMHGS